MLNESTVRSFKAKYYQEINQVAKEKRNLTKNIPKYSQPTGQPLMLGELDSMVQTYLQALGKRGGGFNTSVANATAKALISKYPNIVNPGVDIESSRCAKKFIYQHELWKGKEYFLKSGYS